MKFFFGSFIGQGRKKEDEKNFGPCTILVLLQPLGPFKTTT